MTDKKKIILVVGEPMVGKTARMVEELKERHGENIVIITPKEAEEQGMKPRDYFDGTNIKALYQLPIIRMHAELKSGKQKRRERREQEKKNKKRK